MTTYPWAILSTALVVFPATAAATPPPTQQIVDEFVVLKKQGDQARADKRLSDALTSYGKALAIRHDPLVAGRAGLILLGLGEFGLAAHQLHSAVTDTSTSLSKQDRLDFSKAYSDVLVKVCRVDINVDHVGARVEIDGIESSKGRADFWLFLEPGKHVIQARLQGFFDTIETLETQAETPRKVALVMQRQLDVTPSAVVTTTSADLSQMSHLVPSLYAAKLPPNPYKTSTNAGFVLGFGAWIPFGAAPGVGVGGQLHGGWRSKSWWEIGVEVQGAVTLGTDNSEPGSAYAWAVTAAPCGRIREHFFGCVLVQLNGVSFQTVELLTSPGIGLRARYEFRLNNRFSLGLFGDLAVRFGAPTLGQDNFVIWAGKLLVPALGANVFTFF